MSAPAHMICTTRWTGSPSLCTFGKLYNLGLWFQHYQVYFFRFFMDEEDEVTIKDVAEAIKKAHKYHGEIVYDTSKADGQYKKTASNKKLRSLLKDFQFTDFETAVNDTVKWFKENRVNART